ncbi:hypothetical protein [Streptomyces sp. NBC_00841]|uniref:hypothetical protein n=1 Tax=Streptomyces sp. NBC_00841 TaxID=2975847 RepID=UPI003FA368A4
MAARDVLGNAPARRRQEPYAPERVTVRWSTGIAEFERLVPAGPSSIARNFAADRILTEGYAVVRRTRQVRRGFAGSRR